VADSVAVLADLAAVKSEGSTSEPNQSNRGKQFDRS
jgi:hypothetical protein